MTALPSKKEREATNADEQRLRRYNTVTQVLGQRRALLSSRATRAKHVDELKKQLQQLKDERTQSLASPTREQKKKLPRLEKRIAKKQSEYHLKHYNFNSSADFIDRTADLNNEYRRPQVKQAIRNWINSQSVQSVNVRTLGSWINHQKQWLERNRKEGRDPQQGEYLDVQNDAWNDFINQGWMQKGYERGAMFRLLTPVSKAITDMHNKAAAPTGKWQTYEDDLIKFAKKKNGQNDFWSQSNHRLTFFAQELVDAARAGYVIHHDEHGRKSLMPRQKSALLRQIRAIPR
jgi:hypothetical protein